MWSTETVGCSVPSRVAEAWLLSEKIKPTLYEGMECTDTGDDMSGQIFPWVQMNFLFMAWRMLRQYPSRTFLILPKPVLTALLSVMTQEGSVEGLLFITLAPGSKLSLDPISCSLVLTDRTPSPRPFSFIGPLFTPQLWAFSLCQAPSHPSGFPT